jgi:hypothetical protein
VSSLGIHANQYTYPTPMPTPQLLLTPMAWRAQVHHTALYASAHTHRLFLEPCTLVAPALSRCLSRSLCRRRPKSLRIESIFFTESSTQFVGGGVQSTFQSNPCEPLWTWPAHYFPLPCTSLPVRALRASPSPTRPCIYPVVFARSSIVGYCQYVLHLQYPL